MTSGVRVILALRNCSRPPTERQLQVLYWTREYTAVHQRPPTLREIASAFDRSFKAADDVLRSLRKKGLLDKAFGRTRGLMLTAEGEAACNTAASWIRIPAVPAPKPVSSRDLLCKPPTKRQSDILAFIVGYQTENRVTPSVRDIAAAFGLSSINGVNDHLQALERRGLIYRVPGEGRGIRVLSNPMQEAS